MIDSQVITMLLEAELVLADLTRRNANVFYELGIRHLIQKPVIHLYQRGEAIPFDIQPYRAIEFSYHEKETITEAKIELRKAVAHVLNSDFQVDNPVSRSTGLLRMRNAIGRERGRLAQMAVGAQIPMREVRDKLRALASKTVTIPMKPGAFQKFLAPLERADNEFEKLIIAIASFGAYTVVGGSERYEPTDDRD